MVESLEQAKKRADDAEKERDELKKQMSAQNQQQSSTGALDTIKSIFSFDFGGFFGTIFSGLLWVGVLTGLYYVARSETGQQFLGNIFGEEKVKEFFASADEMIGGVLDKVGMGFDVTEAGKKMDAATFRKHLVGKNGDAMSAEVADVLAQNKDGLLSAAQKANGGKATKAELTNDKTLFTLMTEQPDLVQKLAGAISKSGAAANGDVGKKIMDSLKAILADEARLTTLLTGEHKARTIALMKQFAPESMRGRVDAIVNEGIGADGKLKPGFSQRLTGFVDMAMATPAATGLANQDASKTGGAGAAAPTASGFALMTEIEKDSQNKAAFAQLEQALTAKGKYGDFAATFAGNDSRAQKIFALENYSEFAAFRKAVKLDALPKNLQAQLKELDDVTPNTAGLVAAMFRNGGDPIALRNTFFAGGKPLSTRALVEKLFAAENRNLITSAGVDNVARYISMTGVEKKDTTMAGVTPNMLTSVLAAVNTIATNETIKNITIARDTVRMTGALVDLLVSEDPASLRKLDKDQFAAFFRDETNRQALQGLLKGDAVPRAKKGMAQALLQHWEAFTDVASDRDVGASFIKSRLEHLEKPTAESCKAPSAFDLFKGDLKAAWFDNVKGVDFLRLGEQNVLGKNSSELKKLDDDLRAATCASLPVKAAAASTR